MAKLTKQDTDAYHRALVIGLSGAGKSTLLAELATVFKITWLDLENSKDVLTKLPAEALENINYIRIPDSASYPIAAQTLMTLFKTYKANICVAHGKHDCGICKKDGSPIDSLDFTTPDPNHILVCDSVTQLAASILAYTCKDKPVDYKPERDDWGALRKYSEFFASQMQAFPGNLACTAQAIESELEDGRVKLVPAFGSKDMSGKIAKAFSDLVYIEMKNKKHVAYSKSTASNNIQTKSRSEFDIELLASPSLIPLFKNEGVEVGVKKVDPGEAAVKTLALEKPAPTLSTPVSPGQQAVQNLGKSLLLKKQAM